MHEAQDILLGGAFAARSSPAAAQAQDISVKIGVLNDRSGLYADLSGEGSVVAARMAVEDFKAADKGIKVEIVSADHQNKPDVGSNIARQWYRQGRRRRDRRRADLLGRARRQPDHQARRTRSSSSPAPASSDLTGKACSPNTVHWTYDTCALANGTGGAMVKARRRHLVLPHRRLRLRPCARARHRGRRRRRTAARCSARCGIPSRATDFSSFLLQAQASRAKVIGLANAGGDTINSIKQAAEFGIIAGRPEARRPAHLHHRRARARPADRAGPGADRGLLLGPQRRDPRLGRSASPRSTAARCRPWCRPASMPASCTT